MNGSTPTSLHYELGYGWEMVREFSFPLALFGAVLKTLLPILSVGGSVLLLLVKIARFLQLHREPSNLLVDSLATSDLLIGLLVQPFHSAMSVCALMADDCHSLKNNPRVVIYYLSSFLIHSSCLNIAAITMDRYIFVMYALRYLSIMTESRVAKAMLSIWTISAVLPGTRFIHSFPMTATRVLQIILVSSVLFVISFCYMDILRISRRHKRQITSQLQAVSQRPIDREFRRALTVFMVVGAVILCYTPLLLLQFLLLRYMEYQVKIIHLFAVTLFLLNSSINPLIIILRRREIRTLVYKLFKVAPYSLELLSFNGVIEPLCIT